MVQSQRKSSPAPVISKTFSFTQQPTACRDLRIHNHHTGLYLDIEGADSEELATRLEEMAAGIRLSYGIK